MATFLGMLASPTLPHGFRKLRCSVGCRAHGPHVAVIGGGVGGLVAAGKLAKTGVHVTLLEKNDQVCSARIYQATCPSSCPTNTVSHGANLRLCDRAVTMTASPPECSLIWIDGKYLSWIQAWHRLQVGGRMQSSERDGYRFDTGPSLLLFPETYREARCYPTPSALRGRGIRMFQA